MSLYVPPDRVELHNALASQMLVRHADALSDRGISRDEACKLVYCAVARERIYACHSEKFPELLAFANPDDDALGKSQKPEIRRLLERCAELTDLVEIERRSLRDAFTAGVVTSVAVDAGNLPIAAAYWRNPIADVGIKTGVADMSVDDHRLFSRFLIDRASFENWLNGDSQYGMRPIRPEVSSNSASVSATESLDWEPLWNFDQTLIWITIRDLNLVKLASSRAKAPDSFIIAQDEKRLLMPTEVAVAQLTNALSGKQLTAAIDGETVNPHAFCEAKLFALGEPLFQAYLSPPYPASPRDHCTSVYGFRVLASDMMRLWPSSAEVEFPDSSDEAPVLKEATIPAGISAVMPPNKSRANIREGSSEAAIIALINQHFPEGLDGSITNKDVLEVIRPYFKAGLKNVTPRTHQRAIKQARTLIDT